MLLAVLVCPMHLLGQNGENLTGSVEGTGGAVLAGVKVTLVREETQAKQEIATAKDGSFAFTDLALGNYLLAIEATDFEPYSSIIQVGIGELNRGPESDRKGVLQRRAAISGKQHKLHGYE